MQVDSTIDFSSENCDESTFEACKNVIQSTNGGQVTTDDDLNNALRTLDICEI